MFVSGISAGRSPGVRIALRLAVLGTVIYGTVVTDPGVGTSGRPLAALICLVLASAAALGWLLLTSIVEHRGALAFAVTLLVLAGSTLAGIGPASPALAFCGTGVFAAAATFRVRSAVLLTLAGIAPVAIGTLVTGHSLLSLAANAAALAAISLGGVNRKQNRARMAQAEELLTQTQRTREEHAQAAMLDERSRIAREIHDVLAHSLGALTVQLEAADALLATGREPERARAHVNRARGLAAEGLTETRRAVGALRGDTLPVTRLLAELARTHEADTGTPVAWVQGGVQRPLAPDVALALYRTGQEALSNARKHAPGAEVRVELDYRQDEVVLTVTDHPAGAPVNPPLAASGGGYGLTGLRERAELAGGGLSAGPEGGGWMLRLRLPA